jgi:predicted amidophosphoribosyltransferase
MEDTIMKSNKSDKKNSINYKVCAYCGAAIPRNSEESYCDQCRDRILFFDVKDFIRENDVNEFQVAAHFGIPLRTVKAWIKEGRIEYKETPTGIRAMNNNLRCEICGSPVTFGTICPKCLKQMNQSTRGYSVNKPQKDDNRMRFLNKDKS